MRRFILMAGVASVLLARFILPAQALAGLEEGKAAYLAGDFERAFREFLPLAEAGDPMVQNQIAAMYYRGQGTPQDYARAAQWFREAAEHGSVDAQYLLGKLYLHGQGVEKSDEQAAKWIVEAAHGGKNAARSLASQMFFDGQGVQKNEMKAYFWAVMAKSGASEAEKPEAEALCARIEKVLTPRQIESVNAMAASWLKKKS